MNGAPLEMPAGRYGPGVPTSKMTLKYRLPTVDDVLPYSPLSSIVPFPTTVISPPDASLAFSAPPLPDVPTRLNAVSLLTRLNQEITVGLSPESDRVLHDIQSLFSGSQTPRYVFRPPRMLGPKSRLPPKRSATDLTGISTLGPLAKSALQSADIKYSYSSSISGQKQLPKKTSLPPQSQYSSVSPAVANSPVPSKVHTPVRMEVRLPTAPSPHHPSFLSQSPKYPQKIGTSVVLAPGQTHHPYPPPNRSGLSFTPKSQISSSAPTKATPPGFAIVIDRPASVRLDQYTPSQVDAKIANGEIYNLSRKVINRQADNDPAPVQINYDARAKAETSFQALQTLLDDILEAEDNLQPDTSGLVSHQAATFFVSGTGGGGEYGVPKLLLDAQSRLDHNIQGTIQSQRFKDIPADNLVRIQKMCEPAIAEVESLGLFIGDDWDTQDAEEWGSRVNLTIEGLRAAKLLLRIMSAGREEKVLYSEDLMRITLTALRHSVDMIIVPTIEIRFSDSENGVFSIMQKHRKLLTELLTSASRVLNLLGDLIASVDLAETAISAVEDMSLRLIFIENAHTEKDSVVGIQRFETMRRVGMDVLAKIFKRYPNLRNGIFDQVLTSLEKLPVQRQSARQFRLPEGRPIQLVSALLMRLVQMAATRADHTSSKKGLIASEDDSNSDSEEGSSGAVQKQLTTLSASVMEKMDLGTSIKELDSVSKSLFTGAQQSAQYIVSFLVRRALSATKSGDTPYRNLLDIFTEDFLAVLGSSDWPAAELLLRSLLSQMIGLVEGEKSPVGAKIMALDLMGVMGSGIADLQQFVRQSHHSFDGRGSDVASRLVTISEDLLEDHPPELDTIEFDGPCRIMLEYLYCRDISGDTQLQSAIGYLLAQWSKQISAFYEAQDHAKQPDTYPYRIKKLGLIIRNMITDPQWLHHEYEFDQVSTIQGRLASALVSLNLPFCRAMKRIFSTLLMMLGSEHASLKSRSLKSVVLLLEKDPSILNRSNLVLSHIIRCISDPSTMVRDSALGLLSKCLSLKPSLENDVIDRVVARASDTSVLVRKRAMKILKDIYLRNEGQDVRAAIADAMLQRIRDLEDSVVEIAKQTFEEVWMSPFVRTTGYKDRDDEMINNLALQKQVVLIVKTVRRGETVLPVLDSLLHALLSKDSKHSAANFIVCKKMVAFMFESIIDNNDQGGELSQLHMLQTLTVFAKADAKLFVAQQLEVLEPYVKNLSNTDDLLVYRSVIIIFRHVLPSLSTLQHTFLKTIQDSLLASVSKLGKMELNEVASCLWIIDSVLKNTDRLIRLSISVLNGIQASIRNDLSDPSQATALNRVRRYMMIAGHFGKACDFDAHSKDFRDKFPSWKGKSVCSLFIDLLIPFTKQKQPMALREVALESIGMICQSWPAQFLRPDVATALELVFHNRESSLENIVMTCFRSFFASEEQQSLPGMESSAGDGLATRTGRLDKSLQATEADGVSTCIAQRFLKHILQISVGKPNEVALLATHVIASVNRQGLVHPKECGTTLVALETSPNTAIATIAFQEHTNLHHKHESMFEKEYMKAVQHMYRYHQVQLNNRSGFTGHPPVAKMRPLYEVLKNGNIKIRKRFLSNLISRLDIDLSKLKVDSNAKEKLGFTRFCLENIGLLEYCRVDELMLVTSSLEKLVTSSGTAVAHAIEVEVLGVRLGDAKPATTSGAFQNGTAVQPVSSGHSSLTHTSPPGFSSLALVDHDSTPGTPSSQIELGRLKVLALASSFLLMLWETRTHLRRFFNQTKIRTGQNGGAGNDAKSSGAAGAKELNKAPVRAPGVTHDKFLERIAELESEGVIACVAISGLIPNDSSADSGDTNSPNSLVKYKEARPTFVATCRTFAELLAIDSEHRVPNDEDGLGFDDGLGGGYETPAGEDGDNSDMMDDGVSVTGSVSMAHSNAVSSGRTTTTTKRRRTAGPGTPNKRVRKR